MIGKMVFGKIQLIVLGVLVTTIIGLGVTIWSKNNSIEKLQTEVAEGKASIFLLSTANDALAKTMASQSAAVVEMQELGEKQVEKLKTQKETILYLEKRKDKKVFAVDSEVVPADCVGAMGWMLEKAGRAE